MSDNRDTRADDRIGLVLVLTVGAILLAQFLLRECLT